MGVEKVIAMMRRVLALSTVGFLTMVAACGGGDSDVASTTAGSEPDAAPTTTMAPTTSDVGGAEGWVETDVVYATRISDGKTALLDLYVPAEAEGAPIVIEGGEELVEEGMIVVKGHETDLFRLATGADEYVADRVSVRSYAELFGCEIRLARDRASELGNDNPIVVLDGFSLFGGLAAQVGLFGDTLDARWDEFAAAGGPPRQFDCAVTAGSTDVDAVVGTGGTYDLTMPIIDGAYGRAYQQEHDPEMQEFLVSAIAANADLKLRLIHGTNDCIPASMAEEFAAALSDAGYDVELVTWPGEHEGAPTEIYMPMLMDAVGQ